MNPYSDLFEKRLSIEAEAEFKKLMVMEELLAFMESQQISRTELAKRMGVGPSRVTSMLSGSNNFTMETLVRAGRALNAEFLPHFVPEGSVAHFSTCKGEEVHEEFRDNMTFRGNARPTKVSSMAFLIPSSSDTDDAAAA